jgi:hypothetical protein
MKEEQLSSVVVIMGMKIYPIQHKHSVGKFFSKYLKA